LKLAQIPEEIKENIIRRLKETQDLNSFRELLNVYFDIRREYYLFEYESKNSLDDKFYILSVLEELAKMQSEILAEGTGGI
jgi:hypothetical protein